jgi:hypothetical protein
MLEPIRNAGRAGTYRILLIAIGALTAGLASSCMAGILDGPVTLPIEVMGDPGTTASVPFQLQQPDAQQIRSLWLQVHGLEFEGVASVRINACVWQNLTNSTATVAEPGRNYGGIGGGFATLKLSLPVPAGCLRTGVNLLQFRFNRSDGVVSGFRVLAYHFLTGDGRSVLPAETPAQEDPDRWASPLLSAADRIEGEHLWREAALVSSSLPDAHPIRAHCADCHAQDGRDLKYFNYSNLSIVVRSRFHGLSTAQGLAIASYIRSLPFPHPGRPWNPPYQPGPGLDSHPASDWAAGAGLQWALDSDLKTLPFLFPAGAVTPAAFSPDGNLNPRQLPIAMQLPDWNHWLPRIAPIDGWGDHYTASDFARVYGLLQSSSYDATLFERWTNARGKLLTPHLAEESRRWTPQLGERFYSAQVWQMVKTWELVQRLNLEDGAENPRTWPNNIAALTAPSAVHIPDGPSGMNGSALTNEYFNNAWYQLQLLLNSGNHRHHGRTPVDWIYVLDRERTLAQLSGTPEPARVLIILAKAMQSTDPLTGPQNLADGWRPDRNVDPRIMVDPNWASIFQPLPPALRRAITQSILMAWLDKTASYPLVAYFSRGQLADSYIIPEGLKPISGGKAWEGAARFRAAGIDAGLVDSLARWGASYTNLAGLYQY